MPPVEFHDSHETTKRKWDSPYGCHNVDRFEKAGYYVLARRYMANGAYDLAPEYIEHTMSTECRHTTATTDPRCSGCRYAEAAVEYTKRITAKGT